MGGITFTKGTCKKLQEGSLEEYAKITLGYEEEPEGGWLNKLLEEDEELFVHNNTLYEVRCDLQLFEELGIETEKIEGGFEFICAVDNRGASYLDYIEDYLNEKLD